MVNALIEDYLEHLKLAERSKRTIDARREVLERVNGSLQHGLAQSNTEELQRWIFRDEFSASTKETYYWAVRSFFLWATNQWDPILDFDPSELLPKPTTPRGLPRPFTDEQLHRILTEAVEPYRLWTILACYAGLRCCEIALLDREHVTEQNLLIVRGKGGKPGMLPTHPRIWEAVAPLPPGPLAWTTDGARATAQYVSIRTALYFRRKLGMPGVALHMGRHWYGTTLYALSKDLRRTQELMRHASPTTTAIYTLVSDEERRTAIQALPSTAQPS